jgi:hypothetical protein
MSDWNTADYFANSIGLVVDRAAPERKVLASAWLIDDDKVATTGDSVKHYANLCESLEVDFPCAGRRYGVRSMIFHPLFKRQTTRLTLERADNQQGQFSAIRNHDCAILYLNERLTELSDWRRKEIDRELSSKTEQGQQGLSGNLGEIEFSLLVQTLTNARKQGELIIVDERNHPLAQVFCDEGRIIFARYCHLENELAVNQIVEQRLKNSFYFRARKQPSWPAYQPISKSTDLLLLESYGRLDQLESLRKSVGGTDLTFMRKKGEWAIERLPAAVREQARAVWKIADGLTPTSRLWQLLHLDDCGILQVLSLLVAEDLAVASNDAWFKTAQPSVLNSGKEVLQTETGENGSARAFLPLPVAAQLPLNPYDLLAGAIVDGKTGRIGIKHGQLLGAIDAFDSHHLIHNLPMLPESRGCPIFSNGYVVAMHVGALPAYPEISLNVLEQCLWVESVLHCLRTAGETSAVKRLSRTDIKPVATLALPRAGNSVASGLLAKSQSGCVEVATIGCPRCGATSFSSARFCEQCHLALIPSAKGKALAGKAWPIAYLTAVVTILIAVTVAVLALPQPNLASGHFVYAPKQSWLAITPKRANLTKGVWEVQSYNQVLKNTDTIHLSISALKPCYVYLLQPTNQAGAELIYPLPDQTSKLMTPGQTITYPENIGERLGNKWNIRGRTFGNTPGTEIIVALASPEQLELPLSKGFTARVLDRAAEVYGWGNFSSGFEVELAQLIGDGSKDELRQSSGQQGRPVVFISRLMIKHQ